MVLGGTVSLTEPAPADRRAEPGLANVPDARPPNNIPDKMRRALFIVPVLLFVGLAIISHPLLAGPIRR